jgi:predicted choloylglycine hydrolase
MKKVLDKRLFSSFSEKGWGERWVAHYHDYLDSYRTQFLSEGELKRPSLVDCENALKEYMPEMWQQWKQITQLVQASDLEARLLSFYGAVPQVMGGSQTVWMRYPNQLIRNYEGFISESECVLMMTHNQKAILGNSACLWGLVDGMNEDGLCVAGSFGGSDEVGDGFSLALVLRYVLECCSNTLDAVDVLCRVPINSVCNVTILDVYGQVRTIELSPLNRPDVTIKPFAVNTQKISSLETYQTVASSFERQQILIRQLYDPVISIEAMTRTFTYHPFLKHLDGGGFGTLYTAVYNPSLKTCELRWPHQPSMVQSFSHFDQQTLWISYV